MIWTFYLFGFLYDNYDIKGLSGYILPIIFPRIAHNEPCNNIVFLEYKLLIFSFSSVVIHVVLFILSLLLFCSRTIIAWKPFYVWDKVKFSHILQNLLSLCFIKQKLSLRQVFLQFVNCDNRCKVKKEDSINFNPLEMNFRIAQRRRRA